MVRRAETKRKKRNHSYSQRIDVYTKSHISLLPTQFTLNLLVNSWNKLIFFLSSRANNSPYWDYLAASLSWCNAFIFILGKCESLCVPQKKTNQTNKRSTIGWRKWKSNAFYVSFFFCSFSKSSYSLSLCGDFFIHRFRLAFCRQFFFSGS